MISLPPFVLFFIGAIAVGFTKGLPRKVLVLAIPLLGGLNLWFNVDPGVHMQFQFLGEYTLTPFRADKLSLLFGYLFHLAAFLGFLYALHLGDGGRSERWRQGRPATRLCDALCGQCARSGLRG